MICARCKVESNVHIMSIFNTDELCMDCKDKETKHPKYNEALKAESAEFKMGNYNFAGIGKPEDL